MRLGYLCLLLVAFLSFVAAKSSFSPARPPALPLAVKSPYLNTWLAAGSDGGKQGFLSGKNGGNGGYLAGQWPMFWTGDVTGWAGIIRVDGSPYTWMGLPGSKTVDQTAYEYTSTKSVFTMNVGGLVTMNVTFLSPLTPNDIKRQSLVSSYLQVDVTSLDGKSHDVQLYSDISAEWVSANPKAVAEWDYGTSDGVAYHQVHRQTPLKYSQIGARAEWGNWYWATNDGNSTTYQSGADSEVRKAFTDNGKLPNTKDQKYRAISDRYPVFAFAVDLGSVDESPASTLFTISLAQTDAAQYSKQDGYSSVPSLWTSYFSDDIAALKFFHGDYKESLSLSTDLDNQIARDSLSAGGQNYLTLTSLAARQAFGTIQLCGTRDKYYVFMKEISSNGNMNTVDVIYPAHPIFLYTNPTLLKLVMDPLYELQESGQYPNKYALHDIGTKYPNATGHPKGHDEQMPVEECGNMIIMSLAYASRTGDIGYLKQHYDILKQWMGYLKSDTLKPDNQMSTDDFAGSLANQTNLAIKGIVGIGAMGKIANMTDNKADGANFTATAQDYVNRWQDLGIARNADPPHTTLSYGDEKSHGLLYNTFPDIELGLNIVPRSVYDMQSKFYLTQKNKYGVPLDSRGSLTKLDWELFVAAVSSDEVKNMFLDSIATWINETPTRYALTDLYDTISGTYPAKQTFRDRPVVGAEFALLTIK